MVCYVLLSGLMPFNKANSGRILVSRVVGMGNFVYVCVRYLITIAIISTTSSMMS